MKHLRKKRDDRTMTKDEWKLFDSNKRLKNRRDAGVKEFWAQEAERIKKECKLENG